MQKSALFAKWVLFCIIAFELPKPYYWFTSNSSLVHIFPQFDGPTTESSLIWIMVHQFLCIFLTAALCLGVLGYELLQMKYLDLLHVINFTIIMNNYHRLGNLSYKWSIIINLSLCFILGILHGFWNNHRHAVVAYLMIFAIPTYIVGPIIFLNFGKTHLMSCWETGHLDSLFANYCAFIVYVAVLLLKK